MAFIISLIVGLVAGFLLIYAVDFRRESLKWRNFTACVVGALVLGWIVPWIFGFAGFWSGLILGGVGVVGALLLAAKLNPSS